MHRGDFSDIDDMIDNFEVEKKNRSNSAMASASLAAADLLPLLWLLSRYYSLGFVRRKVFIKSRYLSTATQSFKLIFFRYLSHPLPTPACFFSTICYMFFLFLVVETILEEMIFVQKCKEHCCLTEQREMCWTRASHTIDKAMCFMIEIIYRKNISVLI